MFHMDDTSSAAGSVILMRPRRLCTRHREGVIRRETCCVWVALGLAAYLAAWRSAATGDLAITSTQYSPAMFGIGVPQDDSRWRNALNYALHDLWLSGEFQQIYDRWFGMHSICPLPMGDHKMEPFVKG